MTTNMLSSTEPFLALSSLRSRSSSWSASILPKSSSGSVISSNIDCFKERPLKTFPQEMHNTDSRSWQSLGSFVVSRALAMES